MSPRSSLTEPGAGTSKRQALFYSNTLLQAFLHVFIPRHFFCTSTLAAIFFSVFACIYSMSTRAILTNTIKPGLCILLPL